MLPTESLGWIGFQALKVRLAGRLAGLTRRAADVGRPTKYQNDVDLLDCDLRDIFKTATLDIDLLSEDFADLEDRAQDVLMSLNDMVNEDIIYSPNASTHNGSHDITKIMSIYPKLSALMLYLDASDYKQFSLIGDPGPSLFILPHGRIGDQMVSQVMAWKMFLQRVVARSDKSQSWLGTSTLQSPMQMSVVEPTEQKLNMVHNPVGVVMDAILKEFQQTHCGISHEVKLRVLEELHTSPYQPKLEMLLSCCQSERDWQEAVCDSFQHPISSEHKHDICVAIHKTWKQRTKLRLFVDQRGLFDVTDEGPPISTYDHTEEGLNLLLDKNAFRPISPGAYLRGIVIERFDHREKTALALALARCLMVFFDRSLERASCNWSAENIFFMRSSQPYGELPRWHILVGSQPSSFNYPSFLHRIVPGNPVLLSFAKLLLEIINGEKIPLDIDLQNINKNIGNWAQMCSYVEEARQDGNSFYLQAVQGCLYLHMHLQKDDNLQNVNSSGAAMREVIYEQIVRNLEKELNPDGLKRKRRGSFSERPNLKRLHTDEPLESTDRQLKGLNERFTKSALAILPSQRGMIASRMAHIGANGVFGHDGAERPSQNSLRSMTTTTSAATAAPPRREDFNVAVICAIVTEYNAVCQIFDEFWDEEGDQYGRAEGDLNTYTTGRIGKHNVVLALLPHIGKSNAAAAAASFRSSYTHVELALLVGVCGGVPRVGGYEEDEILLGDVVISRAVVQYDFGRKYPEKFIRKNTFEDNLGKATKNIQSLLKNFETDRGLSLLQSQTAQFLMQLQNKRTGRKNRLLNKYRYPGTAKDRLFRSDYRHMHRGFHGHCCNICDDSSGDVCEDALNATCEELGCEEHYFVERERLQEKQELERNSSEDAQAPSIHLGAVASGDTVLKSGRDRDEIAQNEGVIAFEMEAAGIWGEIPCVIVKGVCDYADSHKNKTWQDFAAATAAAAAKALLHRYPKTEKSQTWVVG
ncbi:uncharacterized protein TrAtP1_009459 [Trichoderma atroviride]|uniref:uncharacterized protein n=1 Tax=Hypocrea atroviridis TaxID=63577 RepID=UPI003317B3E2|nr:hypothetical protein TrAtP1_009459 [Trichoderma atroviride]